MNKDRYVKWKCSCGLAYAHIPQDYAFPYVNGAASVGIVNVDVAAPDLIDVPKDEFDRHMDKWRADVSTRSMRLNKCDPVFYEVNGQVHISWKPKCG